MVTAKHFKLVYFIALPNSPLSKVKQDASSCFRCVCGHMRVAQAMADKKSRANPESVQDHTFNLRSKPSALRRTLTWNPHIPIIYHFREKGPYFAAHQNQEKTPRSKTKDAYIQPVLQAFKDIMENHRQTVPGASNITNTSVRCS